MTSEDRILIEQHILALREMQNDFQVFYKIVKHLLPEIEHTKTLTRMEKEMSDFKKSVKIDIV